MEMEEDQQFCLRWNNHQSTIISVFETLLESETLVDCTLAAEGQYLKAHKVVLSACSPYFATLLSQQFDKHPIIILKDVKFQELKAMMDYMYKGEVNISQDQITALLKVAESLQIKGLSASDNQNANAHRLSVPVSTGGNCAGPSSVGPPRGYTLEQKRPRHIDPSSTDSQELSESREGSSSPSASKKRKKLRRRSADNIVADNHEHSNSSSHSVQMNSAPHPNTSAASTTAATSSSTSAIAAISGSTITAASLNVTQKTENISSKKIGSKERDNIRNESKEDSEKSIGERKRKHIDTENREGAEILIEPKREYDEGNENVEDLTLDDEELLEDLEQAGPSHGAGEGSSQGYTQWQVDRSQDEVFMAAQEAGQQRDPQDLRTTYNMPGASTSIIYEPEITIRKLYKCCRVGMSCSGCAIPPSSSSLSTTTTSTMQPPSFIGGVNTSPLIMMPSTDIGISTTASSSTLINSPILNPASTSSPTIEIFCKSAKSRTVKLYDCNYCSFRCPWKYDLKSHLRQKHGIRNIKKV